jgi:hypothetical protein
MMVFNRSADADMQATTTAALQGLRDGGLHDLTPADFSDHFH